MFDATILVVGSLTVVFLFRIIYVAFDIWSARTKSSSTRKRKLPVKTLVVLGSGGHTTEILALTKNLSSENYFPIEFCKASTDTTSKMRLPNPNISVHDIPRSREVGQSYFSSIFTTLYALLHTFVLVLSIRPGLVLCNGPGTAVPICLAAFCLRIVGYCEGKVVFVESFCRVKSLSLTGKLLYPIADAFLVHWPELKERHTHTVLLATLLERPR